MNENTIAANTQYHKAVERAHAEGYAITAIARSKTDKTPLAYVVASAHSAHIVSVKENALVCDCKAAQNGTYCKHRALVTYTLIKQRDALRAQQEQQSEDAAAHARETAIPTQGNQGKHLYL